MVDLNDVTLIDHNADGLLLPMIEHGAELVANSLINRWLIQALKEGKTQIPVRALRLNTPGLAHSVDSEPPHRELIDARRAVVRLSSAEAQEIVELLRSLSRSHPLNRIAVVVSTDVAYGVMRMLQTLVEDVCVVQPFRDLAEAERWLGD